MTNNEAATGTLTPYDTDTVYEPKAWVRDGYTGDENVYPSEPDDYGRVDFDDSEGATVLTLLVRPDDEGASVVEVSLGEGERMQLVVNGRTVWFGVGQ